MSEAGRGMIALVGFKGDPGVGCSRGFRVQGLEFRVWGLGFGVLVLNGAGGEVLGFRV